MDLQWLYNYCDPSDITIIKIEIPFDSIGINSVQDCDILLSSLNEKAQPETIDSILDFRNLL